MTPIQMPAQVSGTWYEQLPDGFRMGASSRSWRGIALLASGAVIVVVVTRGGIPRDPLMIALFGWAALTTLWQSALALFGIVRLEREGSTLTVFTGIGPIGRRQQIAWEDLTSVHERTSQGESRETEVVLVGARRLAFGRHLTDDRRYFLKEVLKIELQRNRTK